VILVQQIPGYHNGYGGPVPGGDTLPHADGGLCADLPRACRQETGSAGLGIELGLSHPFACGDSYSNLYFLLFDRELTFLRQCCGSAS
jgi:hypothetical protein